MTKPLSRAYSRYSLEAIALLGQMIRAGRIERKITISEIASRMGVSRALIERIEKGDPGCGVGTVFEAAAIIGIPLFDSDPHSERDKIRLAVHRSSVGEVLRLLPKMARKSGRTIKDDF
ncbi:MAG: helix-turn-helix transcriptional regulator [Terracidiphilus sp.]|jgi:transcriptional regulator with XRE-family HTH domain